MWPFIVLGICVGTWLLPRIDEASLRKFTSVVYALVLAQSVSEYFLQKQRAKSAQKEDDALKDQKKASEQFYGRIEVAAAISILCGLLTVLTNNSGPIFNIYLLNCGLSMNQFVATRAVLMAGKNVAKVGARFVAGSIASRSSTASRSASCAWSASSAPSPSRTGRVQAYKFLRGGSRHTAVLTVAGWGEKYKSSRVLLTSRRRRVEGVLRNKINSLT